MHILHKKFPIQYRNEVVDILTKMSLSKDVAHIYVSGTASVRQLLYYADYDANERYDHGTPQQFQQSIKLLLHTPECYIADCKLGNIKMWNVIQEDETLQDYNYSTAKQRLETIYKQHIISKQEYKEALSLLKPSLNIEEFYALKKLVRFGIVRWTPKEIMKGEKKLRDGRKFTLYDGMQDNSMMKLDVVAYIVDKYVELSMIYRSTSQQSSNIVESIKQDIIFYDSIGNHYRALKRAFSLCRYDAKYCQDADKVVRILNSDVGIMYQIVNDIHALYYVIQHSKSIPKAHVKQTINTIQNKMGHIYSSKDYLHKEPKLLYTLQQVLKKPQKKMIHILMKLEVVLTNLLNARTKELMEAN